MKLPVPDYTIDKNQTVAGQMEGLLNMDSSYMKQAASAGKQYAKSRGLLNSTMGAQAAQGASIKAALPIAQADANTYNAFAGQKYGTELQGALNEQIQGFTQGNMELGNQLQQDLNAQQQGFTQENMQLADTIQQTQLELKSALDQGNMELANQLQQELNAQQQGFTQENMQLQNEFDQSKLDQQTQNAMDLEHMRQQSGMYAHYLAGLTEIQSSDMSQEAKTEAANNLWDAIMRGSDMASALLKFAQGEDDGPLFNTAPGSPAPGPGTTSPTPTPTPGPSPTPTPTPTPSPKPWEIK